MSDRLAQKKRPPILNRLSRPVKPAAMAAMAANCSLSSWPKPSSGLLISPPPNTSCSKGEAMPRMPMPAVTFRHSTSHTSQNCGTPQTRFTWTWPLVIIALLACLAGAVQPCGFQPVGGTR
ncbi:hypothetical protein D3C85_1627620 [compost metagenome]